MMDPKIAAAARAYIEKRFNVRISDQVLQLCAVRADGILSRLETHKKANLQNAFKDPHIDAELRYASQKVVAALNSMNHKNVA